ncbi:MAG: sulfite oxidase [Spirosomataceae bacterium]
MSKKTNNRRAFIQKTLAASGSLLLVNSTEIFARNKPNIHSIKSIQEIPTGKHPSLISRGDRPLNLETPVHLLDEKVTTSDKMFVRNNGKIPESIDESTWTIVFSGESISKEMSFTLAQLKSKFPIYSYQITLECGGNGRAGFSPATSGNQWTEGAVSSSVWTGVRLRDILESIGIRPDAVYVGYDGADEHLSGDPDLSAISRGVPLHKAMEDETLLAFSLNGEPIPLLHGFPVRLVVGGYPASVSGKWIQRIMVRNKVHDGEKMNDYRVPTFPVAPGEKVSPQNTMRIIESMPVKSIVTYPRSGAIIDKNQTLEIRGHAWAGELEVTSMAVSVDFGATWLPCTLEKPVNKYAWQYWNIQIPFPEIGYYEIWAKATDEKGTAQPMVIPGWNPKGYLNNSCHRIAIKVISES